MKKLTFKVNSQKEFSVVSLIKEVNNISCRIYIDVEQGFITVEKVNDNMIDNIIELVNKYYIILGVEIDNDFEDPIIQQDDSVIVSNETVAKSLDNETEETVAEKEPILLEPQSEDDLIVQKIEFQNEEVENLINKLLRSIAWAMFKKNVTEKDISKYIYSCINEISMNYSFNNYIDFSVGDVVDCNYGMHLPGEINGAHVSGIICNVIGDMAFVVPITKNTGDTITSYSYLELDIPNDIVYYNEDYKFGTALLDKGKYIRIERFNSVIGKTTSEFFDRLLDNLVYTFDFTGSSNKIDEEEIDEEIFSETAESNIPLKKIGGEEASLLEIIGDSLDKLDKSKSVEEQVESFMIEIGMITNTKMVAESFMIACNIKKINYDNVILELHKLNSNINEDIIKATLKENFKTWLEQYPTLAAKCPKISLMSVLKVFAKRFA